MAGVEEGTAKGSSFVSFGGVWLDELRWPHKPTLKDVVGGSGVFSTLGARLFAQDHPGKVALIVNAGYDFPDEILDLLRRWEVHLHIIRHPDQPATRGVLEYGPNMSDSTFTRLSPPLLTTPDDIASEGLLDTQAFHVFAAPWLAREQISGLESLRQGLSGPELGRPLVMWEPYPKHCSQETMDAHVSLLREGNVTVFSPNHNELASFFPRAYGSKGFNRWTVEAHARIFLSSGANADSDKPGVQAVIVRAAQHGCLVLSKSHPQPIWLAPFWRADQQNEVVDPTGAGNAFLGGLIMGWGETKDWAHAACYGTVAAGFAVQQVGLPSVQGIGAQERWSGDEVRRRLEEYKDRDEVKKSLEATHQRVE